MKNEIERYYKEDTKRRKYGILGRKNKLPPTQAISLSDSDKWLCTGNPYFFARTPG